MRTKRALATVAATAAVLAGGIAFTAPAQAATSGGITYAQGGVVDDTVNYVERTGHKLLHWIL